MFREVIVKKSLSLSLNLIFGLLLFFGCSKSKKPEDLQSKYGPKDPKSITIGIAQEPDSLMMPFKEMMASEEVVRVGNYTLTIFDEDWNLVPWAAESIPTVENGGLKIYKDKKDGNKTKMQATWKIRDDFFWADGKPLIGDDFVLSHEINKDPDQEIIDRSTTEKIESIKVVGKDKKTLVVTLK